MLELHSDVLLQVVKYLEPKEFGQLKQTCRVINFLLNDTVTVGMAMGNGYGYQFTPVLTRNYYERALITSCETGRIDVTEWAAFNEKVSQFCIEYALKYATIGNHIKCVQFLIDHPKIEGLSIMSALIHAAKNNSIRCLKLLMYHPAIPKYQIKLALDFAAKEGNTECIELLDTLYHELPLYYTDVCTDIDIDTLEDYMIE